MSADRQYGRLVFECDVGSSPRCEEMVETGEGDFMTALGIMKSKGWTVHRAGSGYMHCCPRCPVPR